MSRPTDYRAEYCERVVELMADGASKHEVALELGCCFQTFLNWQDANPEFMEAVKRGESLSRGWWERLGRKGACGQAEINPTTYIFNMKNRFREDWADATQREISGKGGKDLFPTRVELVAVNPE